MLLFFALLFPLSAPLSNLSFQEPVQDWSIGSPWEIAATPGEPSTQVIRRLSLEDSNPYLLWVISNGQRAQVGISAADEQAEGSAAEPNASNLLWAQGAVDWREGDSVAALFLPFTAKTQSAAVWVSIEPTYKGKVVLQVGSLPAAIRSIKSRWISYQNPPPPDVLRALMLSATQNFSAADEAESTPKWLPELLGLLEPNRLGPEIRPEALRWLLELQTQPFAQDPSIAFRLQQTLAVIYSDAEQANEALHHHRLAAKAAHLIKNRKGEKQSLQNVTYLVEQTGNLNLIHEVLADLSAAGVVDPSSSLLLADAQWELGLINEAQQNLRAHQKTLVADVELDRHFQVHYMLGKIEIGLSSWKLARWHLIESINAGKQFLRITSETTAANRRVKEGLAGAMVRLSIVLDRVREFAEAERMIADAHFTFPHNNVSLAQVLFMETSCRFAMQRGKVARAKSALKKAEDVLDQWSASAKGWKGRRERQERLAGLSALSQDLAYASAPGGRGQGAWSGLIAANQWKARAQNSNDVNDSAAANEPWNLKEFIRDIPAGTVMIEYCRGDSQLFAYRVDASGVTLFGLGDYSRVLDQVVPFLADMKQPGYPGGLNSYLIDSYSIYNILLAAVLRKGDKDLILCLPPELDQIPFSALADRPSQGSMNHDSLSKAALVLHSWNVIHATSVSTAGGKLTVEKRWTMPAESTERWNAMLAKNLDELGKKLAVAFRDTQREVLAASSTSESGTEPRLFHGDPYTWAGMRLFASRAD